MTYGPTKKAEAWELRDAGVRPEEIARRLEVSPSAIRGWLREQAPPPSKLRQKGQPVALTAAAPPPPPAELPAAVANLWADLHREAPGALQKLVELSQDDDGPEATQLGAISLILSLTGHTKQRGEALAKAGEAAPVEVPWDLLTDEEALKVRDALQLVQVAHERAKAS